MSQQLITRLVFRPRVAVVCLLLLGLASARAGDTNLIVVRGNLEKFTTTPDGLVDGVILDNETETELEWGAKFEQRFEPPLQPGDRLRAVGKWSLADPDRPRFRVRALTNLRTQKTHVDLTFPALDPGDRPVLLNPKELSTATSAVEPSPSPIPTQPGNSIVVRGDIERFTTGPNGETIGAVLDSDTEFVLRWPGRLQERFLGIMKLGDRVRATGRRVMGPTGDNMLLVKSVTNLQSRESAEDPDYRDLPPVTPHPRTAAETSRESELSQRVRNLENQIEALRREIERVRRK